MSKPEPIAICGIGLRLPGGINTPTSLYNFLINRKDARSKPDRPRYHSQDHHFTASGKSGPLPTEEGYWLSHDDVFKFDPSMFSMNPKELLKLDPQQRLLLQVVWEALESAAETDWQGQRIGCYVGSFGDDWREMHAIDAQDDGMYRLTGYMDFVQANRISHAFDLRGPSMTVRTACSAAGLAVHLACQAIRAGECDSAIVAGANLILSPGFTKLMAEQSVLSPDASCMTFDASANGYARAEAINCLYIKKLDCAIRDGNPIRAIIRGSATNSDGRTLGLTTPSAQAQQQLIRDAYRHAGIPENQMWQTAMVECHGTGTAVGDTIEACTVGALFGDKGMLIGSIKPNLGHSEAASAISSIIKAVVSLETRTIMPNIKFDTPSVSIPFTSTGLKVPTEPQPWPEERAERIGVNSFGIGGTNVHIILESAATVGSSATVRSHGNVETPPPSPPLRREPATLLLFSAGHEESLKRTAHNYQEFLQARPAKLEDLSYTLMHRRSHLSHRTFAVVTDDCDQLAFTLPPVPSFRSGSQIEGIAFIFTGQGAQWARMGSHLMKSSRDFLQDIREMDAVLKSLPQEHRPSWDIRNELMKSDSTSRLGEAEFAQPICTAIQIALTRHLARYGIAPKAVVGHSSGEIAAACAAGVLTLKEAIIVAYYRGFMVKESKVQGSMAAIGLGREQVTSFLTTRVVIACENSKSSVTLSGDTDALEAVCSAIRSARPEVLVRLLKVDKAYHSHHMRAVGIEYQSLLKTYLRPKSPKVPFYSSVSSQTLERASDFGAEYWQRNLESPVLFRQAVVRLLQTSSTTLHLEVGPHSALAGPLKQIYTEMAITPSYLAVQKRGSNSAAAFLATIGEMHCRGVPVKFPIPDGARPLTDLPPYPWHLSKTFWPDSRVTQSWQYPEHSPHELLGSRSLDSTSTAPSWRCLLSLDNVPWIADHCVGSDVVFPAAGYIVMAGEVVRQLSGQAPYTIRDLRIANALVLPRGNKIELFTSVRKEELTREETSEWWELTIQSRTPAGTWTTHCRCRVRDGRVSKEPGFPGLDPKSFLRSVEPAQWYKAMSRVGYRYGPKFRGMRKVRTSVKSPAVSVEVSDERETPEHQYGYVLHPVTIDLMLQSLIVANHSGEPRFLQRLYLPTHIDELFVSSEASKMGLLLQSVKPGSGGDYQGDCSGTLRDSPGDEPVVFMKGLRLSPIDLDHATAGTTDSSKVAVMSWEQDISLAHATDLVSAASDSSFPETHQLLEEFFVLCGAMALKEVDEADIPITEAQTHLAKHYSWLRFQITKCDPQLLQKEAIEIRAKIEDITSKLEKTTASAVGVLIKRCYTHAQALFDGTGSPLEVFLKDNALHELYDWMNTFFTYKPLLQLLSHKRGRHLKILEIGAGTGGLTSRILKDLADCFKDGKVLGTYVFTDVSAGFFPTAKERFHDVSAGFLDYRVLDISRDPADQGFSGEEYDLIVASNVLHATPKLNETLQHVRSLLKPDGRLLMHELCCNTKWINFIMGYLSGWWLGDSDNRPVEPYISPEQWEERLFQAGFSSAEVVYDAGPQYKLNATIIARPAAPSQGISLTSQQITLLCEEQSHPVVTEIEQTLRRLGHSITISNPEYDGSPAGSIVVSVIDLCRGDGYFHDMTKVKLDNLKSLLKTLRDTNSSLLWLSRPCQLGSVDPTFAPVLGIARTARVEVGVHFATMELDSITADSLKAVSQVASRLCSQHAALVSNMGEDMEFSYSTGRILIPRCKWAPISRALASQTSISSTKMLQVSRPGALQTLKWGSRQLPDDIPPDHVKVDVHAAGLNFKDVVTAMGLIKPSAPRGLGCEASGIVTAIGGSVTNARVGDRVMVFAPEAACFSTEILVPAQLCIRIPDTLAFADAAGMPCIFTTVLRALVDKAGLRAGQTVLIHSAAGGVGIAAVQVARWIGARVYVTVGSDEKSDFLAREWGVPPEQIFSSRDVSFVEGVKAATGGLGVDVVLNSLSGELLHASWDCVAPHGTFIELGKKDTLAGGKLAMAAFDGNRSFIGVEMANLAAENPAIISRLLQKCVDLYQQGYIHPVKPAKVFPCSKTEDAFRYLYQGTHIGKVAVDMTEKDDAALKVSQVPLPPSFREQATYVLAGGMGGLGATIARWMASHGAKSLLFISRSAGRSNDDQALLSELRYAGCEVNAIPCDIADETSMQAVISRHASSKRIAGVLNLAMVLADGALSDLTLSQWQTATSPKIRGTWNLHRTLPRDIDFFVLFGSTSGVHGYPGQANYAAANTFLDAFSQYRRGLGLPCSVIHLGGVEDVGYVSRTRDVEDAMTRSGSKLVSEADMLRGLQLAIAESRPVATSANTGAHWSASNGQLVLGLDCSTSINDPSNRVAWKHDPRMNLYPDIAENEVASPKEAGSSGLAEFLSSLQSRPEEFETPASTTYLAQEIARRIFGFLMREVDEGGVDITLSPSGLGVDSLMTIEIRNWWKHTLGVEISVLQLTSAQSFDQLGQLAGRQLKDRMTALSKK
ncbi:polyketide synthase [Colletotrichum costaricense]|uniref:Polyketide synthase n=1 Tax=Colletotrichum costaricense TaxID=1209916 RepID=A0AAJ0E0K0_9PEZI|nr:polyketide synthase [Colletotrichum costaricense]KAK1525837.1 polyketide synthase [Colletotrichum costaricense]